MNQLIQLGEHTWIANANFAVAKIDFGNRMTIIRLPDASLCLISPLRFNDALASEIEKIGNVRYLIAPNRHHNLFFDRWAKRFPQAQLCAPNNTSRLQPDIELNENTLTTLNQQWEPGLKGIFVHGLPILSETAFYNPQDKILVITDIAFNIQQQNKWFSRLVFKSYGVYAKFGPSRLIRATIKNKTAFGTSMKTLLDLPFKQIIVSHGACVTTNAQEIFRDAFAEYCQVEPPGCT